MAAGQPVSFDSIIEEGRKKRKAEQLAEEIFGNRRKSNASPRPIKGLGGSLASRVGVTKRASSVPRVNLRHQQTATPATEIRRPRPTRLHETAPVIETRSRAQYASEVNGGDGLYIRGAARTTVTVVASNFAPGTTSADIEHVMENLGGGMIRCTIVASNPTVIAEMDFQEKGIADKVVETFNGKKADGRTLYVYLKATSGAISRPAVDIPTAISAPVVANVGMEVDQNAQSREAQNRLREQHRSGRENGERIPSQPRVDRNTHNEYYGQPPRQMDHRVSNNYPQHYGRGGYGGGAHARPYDDGGRYGGGQWR